MQGLEDQGLQTFPVKGQRVSILDWEGHTVSAVVG